MIPIRNIYYIFLYAWDQFTHGNRVDVGADDSPNLPNLLAKVLIRGVQRQFHRGLDRRYVQQVDELVAPRGKFLFPETIKQHSLPAGRLVCRFDELAIDTVPNRILRAAIRHLHRSDAIDTALREELRRLDQRLDGVTQLPLTPCIFRSLQVMRHQSQYGLLIHVCRLVMELALPDLGGVGRHFRDILDDETRMSAVFETFLRNFYREETKGAFKVRGERLDWSATAATAIDLSYLPDMLTDMTLRSGDRTIVIDAKYYKKPLIAGRFDDRMKVRSGHLYQMQAYLEHSESAVPMEGLLLFPQASGLPLRLDYRLPRHRIRVGTVNLDQAWPAIHDELLELVGVPASG